MHERFSAGKRRGTRHTNRYQHSPAHGVACCAFLLSFLRPLLLPVCLLICSCGEHHAGEGYTPAQTFSSGKIAVSSSPAACQGRTRRFNELYLEAVRQKQLEHIDAEYELLNAALDICPDASEAIYEMAIVKLSFSTYSDTLAHTEGDSLLRRAVELEPGNLYYKETLAAYMANSAQYREAILLYEEIADSRLTSETLATLEWLYKTSGDYAGAIRTLNRLEKLEGRSEQISLEKFQTYLAMKDDEHAYQAIEDLCAEYPLDLRYRVLLGDLYDQHGYHQQALDIYRDVLAAEPDNSYAQISLLAYYKAAGADSLYSNFLRRVVLNPRTQGSARVEAMRSYAIDNIRSQQPEEPVVSLFQRIFGQPQGNRDMAELYAYYVTEKKMPADSLSAAMRRILAIEPDYTKARLQLLQSVLQENNLQEAVRICRDGELYDPAEVTFYYYEGSILYRQGHDKEALRTLQDGVERVDESTDTQLASDVYALLGDVLHGADANEEAYMAYDKALSYNELNLICLNNYAYFLSLEGKELEKAAQMSRLTVETESENATYLDTYAWILYMQRQYEQARIYVNEALRHTDETPENAAIFDHAGDIYFRCGEKATALDLWKRALRLANDTALKKKVQQKIWRRRI